MHNNEHQQSSATQKFHLAELKESSRVVGLALLLRWTLFPFSPVMNPVVSL